MFSVGSGHADEFHLGCRVAIESGSHFPYGIFTVFHLNVGDAGLKLFRQFFTQYCNSPFIDGSRNIGMPVGLRTTHGHEQMSGSYQAGIYIHPVISMLVLPVIRTGCIVCNKSLNLIPYYI